MNKRMGPQASGQAHPEKATFAAESKPQPGNARGIDTRTSPERIAALHAIRNRNRGNASVTQRARLLEALQLVGSVTTFEAMRYLDIFDPRPRKLELMREGYEIVTTRRAVETESGRRHSIGVYALETSPHTEEP